MKVTGRYPKGLSRPPGPWLLPLALSGLVLLLVAVLFAVALASCSGASREEAPEGPAVWSVDPAPLVTIGRIEGEAPGTLEGLDSRYEAEGTWNLRTDLAQPRSFVQGVDGWGYEAAFRGRYRLTTDLSLTVEARYGRRVAEDGFDTAFLATGDAVDLVLREADWRGGGWRVGVSKTF